jgi:hypothetical protein
VLTESACCCLRILLLNAAPLTGNTDVYLLKDLVASLLRGSSEVHGYVVFGRFYTLVSPRTVTNVVPRACRVTKRHTSIISDL